MDKCAVAVIKKRKVVLINGKSGKFAKSQLKRTEISGKSINNGKGMGRMENQIY